MATAREIAKAVGFSVSTVTKVLRGDGDAYRIPRDAQSRIMDAARRLGYSPNYYARALRKGKSGLVAIVGAPGNFPIRDLRQKAAARALVQRGYRVYLFDFAWGGDQEGQVLRDIESLRPEGVLISEILRPNLVERINRMKDRIPMAGLDYIEGAEIDQVYVDREAVGYLAARCLIDAGHRDIAYVLDDGPGWYIAQRKSGFARAVSEAGLPAHFEHLPRRTHHSDSPAHSGYQWAMANLRAGRFTGLAALSDTVALGIMRACFEMEIPIPESLSLIGAEGLPMSEFLAVPLSSVAFPVDREAERAVEFLVERIQGHSGPPRTEAISPEPWIRQSIRPIHEKRALSNAT